MSNITSGKRCKDDFKKFSDLNFSGGFPLGELQIVCAPTSADKSQIIDTSAIICHEVPIYNFKVD